jgi:hypothetical protein
MERIKLTRIKWKLSDYMLAESTNECVHYINSSDSFDIHKTRMLARFYFVTYQVLI